MHIGAENYLYVYGVDPLIISIKWAKEPQMDEGHGEQVKYRECT